MPPIAIFESVFRGAAGERDQTPSLRITADVVRQVRSKQHCHRESGHAGEVSKGHTIQK